MTPSEQQVAPPGCRVRCVAFDFEHKREAEIELGSAALALAGGAFLWIDVAVSRGDDMRAFLLSLGLIGHETVDDALTGQPVTQIARYDDYLHFALSSGRLAEESHALELDRIDCALGLRFLLTLHRDAVPCIERMRKHYHQDFERFARTPSFLVYELWDALVDGYVGIQRLLEARVEALHAELMGESDESVFARVAELGSDLLHFRKVVLPARAVLADLSTRRSLFLSDVTQSFLANLVSALDHLLQELLVDREILSESLQLHESLVSHRTNAVMKKLTMVSVVFLPLTFLCGVYGMNFRHLPELDWRYGYGLFWLAVLAIVASLGWLSRRSRLW